MKLEEMFKKYDTNQSGYIEYAEFKKIWVRMTNVKKELLDRGVKIPKIATNRILYNMLELILDAEEDRWRQTSFTSSLRSFVFCRRGRLVGLSLFS